MKKNTVKETKEFRKLLKRLVNFFHQMDGIYYSKKDGLTFKEFEFIIEKFKYCKYKCIKNL